MYNLMVVDDETILVNGLVQMIREHFDDLDVYGAGNAQEALARMEQLRIDIVLTDIRMPGMDGLTLQERIAERWPRCKVIFLTGYDDFNLIQRAVRGGGLDYLLKTEDESLIVAAIQKALDEFHKELDAEALLSRARDQVKLAEASLQKDILTGILNGDITSAEQIARQFNASGIPLSSNASVLIVLARLDDRDSVFSLSDRMLLIYALRNIAEEYLSPLAVSVSFVHESRCIVWCIQSKLFVGSQFPDREDCPEAWDRLVQFVHGALVHIQEASRKLLRFPVSLVAASGPVAWQEAGRKYSSLKLMFSFGLGLGAEMLQIESPADDKLEMSAVSPQHQLRLGRKRIESLGTLLESGRRAAFFDQFYETFETYFLSPGIEERFKLEMYYALVTFFISYLNSSDLFEEMEGKTDLSGLLRIEAGVSWSDALSSFTTLAGELFHHQEGGIRSRESELIRTIKAYVAEHLGEDLSLNRLADEVFLSGPYLSKLYKQITGESLSDYINGVRLARAKELLHKERMKIHEIAAAIGFDADPSYFYRFFKRFTGITPQEFRDQSKRITNDSSS